MFDPSDAARDVARGFRLTPLWWTLGIDQTVTRFRRTLLGPFWMATGLLATAIALSFVFGGLLGQDYRSTFPFVITGILAWGVVGSALIEGAQVFSMNAGLMQTQNLPLTFYVLLGTQRILINFAAQLLATWGMLLLLRLAVFPSPWLIPGILVVTIATSLIIMAVGFPSTRFRDVGFLMGFVAQLLFFMSPVFWQPTQMASGRRFLADFNPAAHMLELIRQPMLGQVPALDHWIWSLGTIAVLILVNFILLATSRKRVVFWL